MKKLIDRITAYCIREQVIPEAELPWLRYRLESFILTALGLISFFFVALFAAGFWWAVSFLGTFYFLRTRTNGFHAGSVGVCFVLSLGSELLILFLGQRYLTPVLTVILFALSVFLIFWLAPFDHPNMNYTKEELLALRNSVRIRLLLLTALFLGAALLSLPDIAKGITTGIALAAILLCLAYILERWQNNEHTEIQAAERIP